MNFLIMVLVQFLLHLAMVFALFSAKNKELIDVVFIVDGSAHASKSLFRQELLLIPHIVSKLSYNRTDIRFGLITYSDHATLQMGLGNVKNNKALLERLWQIRPSDSEEASLCYALRLVRTYMFKDDLERRKFVIVFPNCMWNLPVTTSTEVKLLRKMGVRILMVVIGDYMSRGVITREMDTMSIIYRPHITMNFIEKKYIFNFITNHIYQSQENVHVNESTIHGLDPTLETPRQSSATARITQADITTTVISTTEGVSTVVPQAETSLQSNIATTLGPIEEPTIPLPSDCSIGGELAFLIDASSGVSATDFSKILQSCNDIFNVIRRSRIDIDIAIVTFGTETVINLSFKDCNTTRDISALIMNIKRVGGVSGLGTAIDLVNKNLFLNVANFYKMSTVLIFTATQHKIGIDPILRSNVMRTSIGINFVAVRIGNKTDRWINDRLSGRVAINVKDFDELTKSRDRIIDALCQV